MEKQGEEGSGIQTVGSPADEIPPKISVEDPRTIDALPKYVIYFIRGIDKTGPFEVQRRYKEFDIVRTVMVQRWPGCYVPPVPPKKAMGNLEQQFVEERMHGLNEFCNNIAKIPFLYYSDEFKLFLRSTSNDIEKTLSAMPMQYDDIIMRYSQHFSQLAGLEIGPEIALKIDDFTKFVRTIQPTLTHLRDVAQKIVEARNSYAGHHYNLVAQIFPQFEKMCLAEYDQGKGDVKEYFNSPTPKVREKIARIREPGWKNELEGIYEMLKTEIKEVEAISDSLNMRFMFEDLRQKAIAKQKSDNEEISKIRMGKSTFKSLFTTKKPEEVVNEIQKSLEATTRDIDNLTMICDIIQCILGYIEIDKFKKFRLDNYTTVIRALGAGEIGSCTRNTELWEAVTENFH